MGTRAEALAKQLEEANDAVIAAVEECSDEQWRAHNTDGDQRSVAVLAHHIGTGHQAVAGLARAVAMGETPPPVTMEMIDHSNMQHAQQFANCTKAESLELLRTNGAQAAAMVRGLSDEQLDRTGSILGGAMTLSAQQVIENILIGHPKGHLENMRAAMTG